MGSQPTEGKIGRTAPPGGAAPSQARPQGGADTLRAQGARCTRRRRGGRRRPRAAAPSLQAALRARLLAWRWRRIELPVLLFRTVIIL